MVHHYQSGGNNGESTGREHGNWAYIGAYWEFVPYRSYQLGASLRERQSSAERPQRTFVGIFKAPNPKP